MISNEEEKKDDDESDVKTHVLKDVDKGIEDMYDVAKVVELT